MQPLWYPSFCIRYVHLFYLHLSNERNIRFMIKKILFVCFVVLRPKSTAMVMAERSVHLKIGVHVINNFFLITFLRSVMNFKYLRLS